MSVNKKIKNAHSKVEDGINFDSKLELQTYKLFKEKGFNLQRESVTYTLFPSFYSKTKCYIGSNLDSKKIRAIKYTPDFVMYIPNYTIILECKGFANDVYPYKRKLFRYYMDNYSQNNNEFIFFEISNRRDIIFAINKIIDLMNYNK